MFLTILGYLLLGTLIALVCGSLLSLSSSPHWFIRGWDFPRVQIIVIAWSVTAVYALVPYAMGDPAPVSEWVFVLIATGLTVWHGCRIIPYTPVFPQQAKPTARKHRHREDPATLRMVVSNVEMENDHYDRWVEVVTEADPDVLIALEPDKDWIDSISPLLEQYPHRIVRPQDNWYGMMLLSRLPILRHRVRFLVQDDIPSIDAHLKLDDGREVRVIAVHPRPPEPIRGNDATARDAELTLWGQELVDETEPTIIGGDLNDVAWSATTRLFLRTSGMLDPRRGRGFFNTFHADHWYCRYPLDHIFHSPHFTVTTIQRLPHIGSDHFPMLIDLRLEPEKQNEHEVLEEKPDDQAEVDLRIERAREDEEINGEAVSRDPEHAIRD
ncbi:endonuclease/exonuclease/phosphatase family protein [Aporhodopirellula aestuarii]|uniref:Endonuclease/exonuclease/phosphatase family protein n=1 Tax=Aporhodopirellula aestuarii TaxID=2950107 RepID=A0ABT0UBF0_9BACT|nr:endonuclease/exonuclease/phosphatase family protein [Aporhodopirellula aestuarii]MCM2373661.1 endonuclease/exonuclease/phosphatase family protein [Aporhodopirellula aestuarii]